MQILDTTHVLIADDHPLFRAAMRHALQDIINGDIIEAEDFHQARAQLESNADIELVFLDLSMPGNQGLTGLSQLRLDFPNTLVVVVSAQDDVALIRRAVTLGSSGYIPKSTPLPEITEAVKSILNGDTWIPADIDLEDGDSANEADDFAAKLGQLTPHQFKVLNLMANGLLNKQIAYELSISESTVKQHASAVLKKLGVINRTQAGVLFKQAMQSEE
ncbi:response regulator transcription factor [Alteromonas facilis]|uniref:response regulator transcription factor n=1 Tax=Alteromonas facilis TaxID=2048004 RepID=UPI000C28F717|nr:response regulator transcription factor [Alteromonas facilis]